MQVVYAVSNFLDQGGASLYVIFTVAVLMVALVIERFFYIYYFSGKDREELSALWEEHQSKKDAEKIREALKNMFEQKLYAGIAVIKMLVTISPLLGLFGTVYGMIEIFDVIAQTGTGDARAMAGGISMATLSTMSGMAVAITGLFFHHRIEGAAKKKIICFNNVMEMK